MSQRNSGYARKENDFYRTPEWVTEALIPHLLLHINPKNLLIWEPAAGDGTMGKVLADKINCQVLCTDLDSDYDFLLSALPENHIKAIITNPPYELAADFCERAIRLMEPCSGTVAMLLRTDFEHAKSRRHLFAECPAWAKKVVLTKRITWFQPEPGERGKSPSFNHAWHIWDWNHDGPARIGYAP